MIIHIDGITGSGKTTLGKQISSKLKIDIIELDDIHNKNAQNLLSNYNFDINQIDIVKYQTYLEFNNELLKKFMDELLEINQIEINEKLQNYKDKHLLITGNLENIVINVNKGYYIKLEKDIYYKQYNTKVLNRIYENYNEIKEILNSDISLYKKRVFIAIKYRVPPCFIPNYDDWLKTTECSEYNADKLGYKYATPDEIINEIEQLLK